MGVCKIPCPTSLISISLTDNTLGIICINIVIHALDIASGREPVARPQTPVINVQQNQDDGIIEGT